MITHTNTVSGGRESKGEREVKHVSKSPPNSETEWLKKNDSKCQHNDFEDCNRPIAKTTIPNKSPTTSDNKQETFVSFRFFKPFLAHFCPSFYLSKPSLQEVLLHLLDSKTSDGKKSNLVKNPNFLKMQQNTIRIEHEASPRATASLKHTPTLPS